MRIDSGAIFYLNFAFQGNFQKFFQFFHGFSVVKNIQDLNRVKIKHKTLKIAKNTKIYLDLNSLLAELQKINPTFVINMHEDSQNSPDNL